MSRRRARRGLAVMAIATVMACAREEPKGPPPLETVDVAPAPDAAASLANEPVAARPAPEDGFSGVLPAGFPADLPMPRPSSLVDVELGEGGRLAVVLASPASPRELASAYGRQLRSAGWQAEGPSTAGRWRKGARSLRVELVDARPGSRLRLELAGPA